MGKIIKEANLFCKAGAKDAVYHAQVIEVEGGYVANYQNGRAGGTLASGTMTATPVPLEVAIKAFDKKIQSKLKASPPYLPMEAETASAFTQVTTEMTERATGLLPQLLNEMDHEDICSIKQLVADPRWVAQHKVDGERRGIRATPGEVAIGSNRRGLAVALPQGIADSVAGLNCALDGEILGDTFYAFDLYELDGKDMRPHPLRVRIAALEALAPKLGPQVRVLPCARTQEEKQFLIEQTRSLGQEGVVWKDLEAPYVENRPSSGGPQLKLKHWKKAMAVVARANTDRRSVVMAFTAEDGSLVEKGSVTIGGNTPIPSDGAVVWVKYLYVASEQGSLFEPSFIGVAVGAHPSKAHVSQLKVKQPHVDIGPSQRTFLN